MGTGESKVEADGALNKCEFDSITRKNGKGSVIEEELD